MDAMLQRLALFARAEALAMRIRARRAVRLTVLSAGALAAALFAFGLLNVAAFNALAALYGQTIAALLLAVCDALVALLLATLARRRTPSEEEVMVDELRALALAGLSGDAERLRAQLMQLQQQMTHIGEAISRITAAQPLQFGLSTIAPIVAMASRLVKRRKAP